MNAVSETYVTDAPDDEPPAELPRAPKLQQLRMVVVDYDRRPTFNQLWRDLGTKVMETAYTIIVYFEGDVWVAKDRSGQHQGMWA